MPMEWNVFTTLAAIVALFLSVGTPIIKLNGTISELNTLLEQMQTRVNGLDNKMEDMKKKSVDSHRRIWAKIEEQDQRRDNHELRLKMIEKDNNGTK